MGITHVAMTISRWIPILHLLAAAVGSYPAVNGAQGEEGSTFEHAGLDRVTSGQIFLGGDEISSMNEKQLTLIRREKIGFVFQAFAHGGHRSDFEMVEHFAQPVGRQGGWWGGHAGERSAERHLQRRWHAAKHFPGGCLWVGRRAGDGWNYSTAERTMVSQVLVQVTAVGLISPWRLGSLRRTWLRTNAPSPL